MYIYVCRHYGSRMDFSAPTPSRPQPHEIAVGLGQLLIVL